MKNIKLLIIIFSLLSCVNQNNNRELSFKEITKNKSQKIKIELIDNRNNYLFNEVVRFKIVNDSLVRNYSVALETLDDKGWDEILYSINFKEFKLGMVKINTLQPFETKIDSLDLSSFYCCLRVGVEYRITIYTKLKSNQLIQDTMFTKSFKII